MFSIGELYRGKKIELNCKDMQKRPLREKIIVTILGLLLCLILLELGVRITGFVFFSLQEHRNRISIQQKRVYRIMCVGESTTAIGGIDSYPSQLEEVLNQRNIGVKFSVINKGVPSGNTMCIMAELEENLNTYNPDMVIAMMGINDGGDYRRAIYFSEVFRTYKLAKFLWFYVVNKNAAVRGNDAGENIAGVINNLTQPKNRKETEEMFKKVYNSTNPGFYYFCLADEYTRQEKYKEAGECYEKVIESGFQKKIMELEPKNCWVYSALGKCYKRQGRYKEAEEVYKKIAEIRPDTGYTELAILYKQQGENKLAEEYFRKARKFKAEYYNSITRHNYQKLKEILALRGIKLVSVQYPTRSLEPLRKMLGPQEGIIFVDNEMVFKKALEQDGYSKYFEDACYSDFGHCTKKGNRLLAENIATVLLDKVFLPNNKSILRKNKELQ